MTHRGPFQPLSLCDSVISTGQLQLAKLLDSAHSKSLRFRYRVKSCCYQDDCEVKVRTDL